MTRLALTVAAIVVLTTAGVAESKELASATFCGASGCRTVDHPGTLTAGGDGVGDAVPAIGPYYTVRFTVEHEGQVDGWQVFWIPGADTLAFRDELGNMTFEHLDGGKPNPYRDESRHEEALSELRYYTQGIEPYAMPAVVGATVGGKPVADPSSYLALYGRERDASISADADDWLPVELKATRPSPWTDSVLVVVSPSKRIVEVGGTSVARLSAGESRAITARESLAVSSAGTRWSLVAGAALALALLVTLALVARAARRVPREELQR